MAPRWEPHRKQHCIPHPSTASRISAPHPTSRNGTGGSHTPPGWRHSRTCSPLAGDAINMRGALLIELLNTAAGHRNSSALRFHPKLDWNSQTGTFLIFFFTDGKFRKKIPNEKTRDKQVPHLCRRWDPGWACICLCCPASRSCTFRAPYFSVTNLPTGPSWP